VPRFSGSIDCFCSDLPATVRSARHGETGISQVYPHGTLSSTTHHSQHSTATGNMARAARSSAKAATPAKEEKQVPPTTSNDVGESQSEESVSDGDNNDEEQQLTSQTSTLADAPSSAPPLDNKKKNTIKLSSTLSSSKYRPKTPKGENELSQLIPGYTAPMQLEAKSLKGISGVSLSQLRSRAEQRDATIINPSISILNKKEATFDPAVAAKKVKTPSSLAVQKNTSTRPSKIPTSFSSSFRKAPRKQHDPTAGKGWFGMAPTPMTDSLKTDLTIIKNRNYLDPKKFYKSADSFEGKVLQLGTVIEGSSEYYSSRLTKRERRQNLTEEIMADGGVTSYAKRKYLEVQGEKQNRKERSKGRGNKRR
jgi:hypothetical protein